MCNESIQRQNIRWRYRLIAEKMHQPDLGEYDTYGIQVLDAEYTMVSVMHDVSVCKQSVEEVVALFNLHQLSPSHLHNAIEDFVL